MLKGIVKLLAGIVAIGLGVFTAAAAAGLAGDGLSEAVGNDSEGDHHRKVS